MINRVLIFFLLQIFFCPLICEGQQNTIDKLENELAFDIRNDKYDSLLIVCNQIKKLDKKLAKENNVDYYIADAYFHTKQYNEAIKYSKRYFRKFAPRRTRVGLGLRIYKRYLAYNLYEIYMLRNNTKMAVSYLVNIDEKYDGRFCGTGKKAWRLGLYDQIIECYSKLKMENKVAFYRKKKEKLSGNS
jgi:tetratricopeptide (TPR) repeat protein